MSKNVSSLRELEKTRARLNEDITLLYYDLAHVKHKGSRECIRQMLAYAQQRESEVLTKISAMEVS